MRIVAIIPAHLASVRFPRKVLYPFVGLPMIEHVRRRALLCPMLSDVYVATCDPEIAEVVEGYGGKVIMTASTHRNGTNRAAEAIQSIECTHVILLQADEPLLPTDFIVSLTKAMTAEPDVVAWNATGPIEKEEDLEQDAIVKCVVTPGGRILLCSRRSPCLRSSFVEEQQFVRKILGMVGFTKSFLENIAKLPETPFERAEFIEQSRILEHGFVFRSMPVPASYPSVNEPWETEAVQDFFDHNKKQKKILNTILIPPEHLL